MLLEVGRVARERAREREREREREEGRLMTGIHKATFPLISHFDSHTQVGLRGEKENGWGID